MFLARAIHFDESDRNVFHSPARTGEWAISGGFEFSNWSDGDLVGKARQAFANGWLGIETFGRVTFVATTQIEDSEYDSLTRHLAQHFVDVYGAPSVEEARPVAEEELRQMGIAVQEFTPSRGNDKMVRLNAVADLFSSGKIWAPDTRWAREVIEEMAAFPVGEHDDYVDTTTQALLRYRQGGFISLDSDEKDDRYYVPRRAAYY